MHTSQRPTHTATTTCSSLCSNTDSYEMFNLLAGLQLLDQVEGVLPEHREKLFPPTETLSMFLAQSLSAESSCQQVVNDALLKRVISGLELGKSNTGAYM